MNPLDELADQMKSTVVARLQAEFGDNGTSPPHDLAKSTKSEVIARRRAELDGGNHQRRVELYRRVDRARRHRERLRELAHQASVRHQEALAAEAAAQAPLPSVFEAALARHGLDPNLRPDQAPAAVINEVVAERVAELAPAQRGRAAALLRDALAVPRRRRRDPAANRPRAKESTE